MKIVLSCLCALLAGAILQAEPAQEPAKPAKKNDTVFMAESAIYRNMTDHKRYKECIPAGTRVSLLVQLTQQGDWPVVTFLYPKDAKIAGKNIREYRVCAHLAGHQSLKHLKDAKPFILDAIVVNEGLVCYNAYFLYVEGTKPLYDATGAPMPDFPEEYKDWE